MNRQDEQPADSTGAISASDVGPLVPTAGDETRGALAGVFAPICTPFATNEDVDYPALRYNLARYANSGIRGYLALGSNGENRSLTENERRRVLGEVVRAKGRGQVVMAGAAYDAERESVRFLAAAAAIGADFGLVLSPGYFRKQMTDEVLYGYFSRLADTARIPLLLYNAPGFCGITLSLDLVTRLADHPNIVGMKDSASSGIEQYLPLQSASFHVLAGSANFLFPAMMGGSAGGTVSLANSFPDVALKLFEYGRARDQAHGAAYQEWVTRVNHAISGAYGVPGVKAAMSFAGFRAGIPRRPLLPLEPAQVAALRDFLIAEGLLE
jgi:Dihydrodipicolinate synthase/N-acetylneuraminate lyase